MITNGDLWIEHEGEGPVFATAVHAGHKVRRELLPILALDDIERSREEDPYTDYWVKVAPSWLVPTRSRFEVDLNRPRDEAVYLTPEVAWGLHVWKQPPEAEMVAKSLAEYDAFYAELETLLQHLAQHHRRFVILDLHAYNYRRQGSHKGPADPGFNPDINIGTGSLDRVRWGSLVDRFAQDLTAFDFFGQHLDVRENIKFKGRQLAQWIHTHFAESACVLSVEFKKFYMDEWTGVGEVEQIQAIRDALQSTIPGIMEELRKVR
ncbi:MAG: N-formylglutamate amidohydrolase [Gammaproteobacteria bacterium]|nr:MAG: N-formylglutamate amidohydrolase [Gammaproteobacteria bacterium]